MIITLAAAVSISLGGWPGGGWTPPSPPVAQNSSVECDPCKTVRPVPNLPNAPQLFCANAPAGNANTTACGAPPATAPSWTQ